MGIPTHGVFAVRKNARRFALVSALAALLIVGAAVILHGGAGRKNGAGDRATAKPLPKLPAELVAAVSKDSDGDGLKDWEESVWRTDPRKADSDGDGTPDGEEVAQNRDPAKAGPDDHYAIAPEKSGGEEAALERNLTARIGAKLSADVIEGLAGGREPDPDSLADAYAKNLGGVRVLDGAAGFTAADLAPAPASDLLTVVKFLAAIEEAWKKHFAAGQVTDVEVFLTAFQNNKGAGVASALAPYTRGYAAAMETVRTTPAPKDLQPFALDFLNFLSKIQRSAELMQGFASDPLAAVLAVQERVELNKEFDRFIAESAVHIKTLMEKKFAEATAARTNR